MDVVEIKAKVKEIIANVTSIDPSEIADDASFTQEMGLDSLSLLEVGVDVDYEFKLELPEERMRGLDSVNQTAELVQDRMAEQGRLQAEVA